MDSQRSTDAEETPTTETSRSETLGEALNGPIDTKLRLIQHHAKMARLLAEEVLEEEVTDLAGKRYSRKEEGNSLRRWGSNSGSIRIDGEKIPIDVPRVRDTDAEEERSLESYEAMKLPGNERSGGGQGADRFDPAGPLAGRLWAGRQPVY